MTKLLIVTIIAVVLNAIVSACEAALLAVPQSRVVSARMKGNRSAAILEMLKQEIQRPLAVLVILSNVVTIITASIFGAVAVERYGDETAGGLLVGFTILVVIFAEVVPKIVGARRAEAVALGSTRALRLLTRILGPFIRATYFIADILSPEKSAQVSEDEIQAMASMGATAGSIEADEAAMIRRVFRLNDITAGDLMTPAKQVFYLNGEGTLGESKRRILDASHSRIPVTEGNSLDRVTGVVHQRELLIALEKGRFNDRVKDFAKDAILVEQQVAADELLRVFQKARTLLAVVINSHGAVSGVVTLEDCLEELVGEIIDENDVVPDLVKRVKKEEIIAHGGTRGKYVNSLLQANLPELQTLAEFLKEQFHRIPAKNDTLTWNNLEFRIEEVSPEGIQRVRVTRLAPG